MLAVVIYEPLGIEVFVRDGSKIRVIKVSAFDKEGAYVPGDWLKKVEAELQYQRASYRGI